jgi:hypothetical protein
MFPHRRLVLAALAAPLLWGCKKAKRNTGKSDDSRAPDTSSPPSADAPDGGAAGPVPQVRVGTKLTTANLKKIKSTSTREDIVAIFGQPRTSVTGAEVAQALLGNPNLGVVYESEVNPGKNPVDMLAYLEEGRVLVVGVTRGKLAEGDARVVKAWMATRNGDTGTGTLTYETLLGDGGPLRYSKQTVPVPKANR